ncbi:MAG: hypothetical protein IJH51_02850, partial [Christensenellaceae bacterium]|nr:hypothetical protein [Christensenellaceae bacterium]
MKNSTLKKLVCIAVCMLLIVSLPLMAFAEDDSAAVADTASEPVAEEVQDAETPADPSVPEKAEEPAAGDAPVVVAGEAGDAPEEPAVEVKAGDTPAPAVAQTAVAEEPAEDIKPLEAVVNGAVVSDTNNAVPETGSIPKAKASLMLGDAAPKSSEQNYINYNGDVPGFYKEDGETIFGMMRPSETADPPMAFVIDGSRVKIYYVPNKATFSNLHWGFNDSYDPEVAVPFEDNHFEFDFGFDMCGKGRVIAALKANGDKPSAQYYFCVPAKDKIPAIADFSAVKSAVAAVPDDLSIYTEASVKSLEDAIAVTEETAFGYKSVDEQTEVNAAAQAIRDAIAALKYKDDTVTFAVSFKATDKDTGKDVSGAKFTVKDTKGNEVKPDASGVYTLIDARYNVTVTAADYEDASLNEFIPSKNETVTIRMTHVEVIPPGTTIFKEDASDPSKTNLFNTTGMFKVIKGTLVSKGDNSTLTIVMSGSGYRYLYKGTYEQCLAGGLDESKWIAGKKNADGKWEFVIPVKQTETFIPIVAISNSHLEKVKAGEETLGDAIFARQLVIDPKAVTLTAGDYDAVIDIQVISKSDVFKADSKGTMEVIGGPNSNNYACKPVITMLDSLYDKAFIGTAEEAAKAGSGIIKISGGKFAFSFTNSFGEDGRELTFEDKKPIAVAFYDTKDGKWIDHKLTIDKAAATVTIESLAEGEAPPEKPAQPDK